MCGRYMLYPSFLVGLIAWGVKAQITDTIVIPKTPFIAGCTEQLHSIATDVRIDQTRSWSINGTVVYSFRCNPSAMCLNVSTTQTTYDVIGTAIASSNSVNSTIYFTTATAATLSIEIVNSGDIGISPTESVLVEVCGDQPNDPSYINPSSCIYGHYNCDVDFSCGEGKFGSNVTASCMCDGTWSNTINCTAETTTPMPVTTASTANSTSEATTTMASNTTAPTNSSNSRLLPPGDTAGTVLTVAFFSECVVAGIAIYRTYVLTMIVKIFYVVCSALCVPGILMSFLGTDPGTEPPVPGSTLNGVEIAGIVIATIGAVLGIVGVALHFQGKEDKG